MFHVSPATKLDTVRRIDGDYIYPGIRGRWLSDDGREGSCELFRVVEGKYVTLTASIDFGHGPKATAYPRLRDLPLSVQNLVIEAVRA